MNYTDLSILPKQDIQEALEKLEQIILRALNVAKINGDPDQVVVIQDHLRRFYEANL